jgi:predicted nucleic acid-binding protein
MILLLDNTVLSNFALVGRSDLLQQALGTAAATTAQAMAEFETGVKLGRIPTTDWKWLPTLTLSPVEKDLYQQLLQRLNAGEAACLAMAAHRQARVLTDDRDARALAAQMRISVSGTVGMLVRLVKTERLTLSEANHLLKQMIGHGYHSPVEALQELLP